MDGSTPVDRVLILAAKLEGIGNPPVNLRFDSNTWVLFIGPERWLTVTPTEAKAHSSSVASLANLWARNLREALSSPPIALPAADIVVPVGANRVLPGGGFRWSEATVSSSAPDVFEASKSGNSIVVRALAVGSGTLTVAAGESVRTVAVTTRVPAASFPQTVAAYVSGSPASASTVQGAVEGAIRARLAVAPNASVRVTQLAPLPSVPEGGTRSIQATVRVDAPGAIPVSGQVQVIVRNLGEIGRREDELWYCNDPENIRRTGPLFSAFLRSGTATRLLYHHINTTGDSIYLRIQLVNNSDTAARIAVIPGDSEADPNPVRAGLRAAGQYLRSWTSGSGEVVTVPPRSTMPISFRRMGHNQTVSGLCSLRLLDGPADVQVRTDAWPIVPVDSRWQSALNTSAPWRITGTPPIADWDLVPVEPSSHIYPNPFKQATFRYEVGRRFGFFKIGERPIQRQDENRALDGNFGVIYTIRAEAVNPTSDPADLELVFEASAGYSGALFLINGAVRESPLLQPKAEYRIERFRLSPGESRTLEISTIPLSGSSYPALISLRPFQPLSTGVGER
jgi:hypothetical protein